MTPADRAAEIEILKALVETLKALVRELEWSGPLMRCPECHGTKPSAFEDGDEHWGHVPGCHLEAKIAAIQGGSR